MVFRFRLGLHGNLLPNIFGSLLKKFFDHDRNDCVIERMDENGRKAKVT
jgi:hypothetical protein